MKTISFIALTLALLTSCSEQGDSVDTNDRAIRLNAGVTTVLAKSAITVGSFDATVAGWETSQSNPDYTSAPTWTSPSTTITIGSGNNLTLTGNPEYNIDNNTKTFITAWYPKGTLTNGDVTIDSPNGDVDVMYAGAVSGSLGNKINIPLTFNHLLTQFKFIVINGGGWNETQKLQSIMINNAQLPQSLNVGTGVITYTSAVAFNIQGIAAQTITTTGNAAGNPVMIAPITGNSLPLTIVTDSGSVNITAKTTDQNYEIGKAYTVTITFNNNSIGVSASVTAWEEGSASGSVIPN